MSNLPRILAIGAHPDDIELGCGGSLSKLACAGAHVHALVLSHGHQGAEAGADRAYESAAALRALGTTTITQLDFPDTRFPEVCRELTTRLEQVAAEFQPDRVYTMSADDRHQDHRTVFETSRVALRRVRQVLCYETPSSLPRFMPDIYEDISSQMEVKLRALRAHASQQHRHYMGEAHVRCLAQFRGQQVGLGPCEGFVPHRMVL
ncbi:PIG-L deacetylase family protein [Stenotrophomonas sp.]|uniref:PIG-L deacetylase family protein n=1 Tax=Stenotrophomonas sp. TaxID=69392 RepID=UPI0028AFA74C|nr:PIG-L deacetylase family protein [Stenotrophomonas sp.]